MIKNTITNNYEFWEWLRNSDNYKDNFSLEGAKAVQEYYEQLSDDLGEDIEFDPIAWCVAWSEYDSYEQAYKDIDGSDDSLVGDDFEAYFMDKTTALTLDNGHCLIEEF